METKYYMAEIENLMLPRVVALIDGKYYFTDTTIPICANVVEILFEVNY